MFLNNSDFPELQTLQDAYPMIKEEFDNFDRRLFTDYYSNDVCGKGKWQLFGFKFSGRQFPQNEVYFPKTVKLMKELGFPTHSFSLLKAHSQIDTHTGYTDTVYRVNMGIDVIGDCGIEVNGEKRQHENGKVIIFDDTVPHWAWNNSDKDRVILLCEVLKKGRTHETGIPERLHRIQCKILDRGFKRKCQLVA